MLTSLKLRHFATIEQLVLEPLPGLTVLTGETGAGKSIIIDALSLALGARADSTLVRTGCQRAEVEASFCIKHNPAAQQWLQQHELDDGDECTLRRTIRAEGPSRAYINGRAVPLQDCRELGAMLVNIHSQHEQQALLQQHNQQRLFDNYAQTSALAQTVQAAWQCWQRARRALDNARAAANEQIEREALISFQLEELDALSLEEGELHALEQQHKRLNNNDLLVQYCQQSVATLYDGGEQAPITDLLGQVKNWLQQACDQDNNLSSTLQVIESAQFQVEAAYDDLRTYLDTLEEDPAELQRIDNKLSTVYQLARRHRVRPEELVELHQELREQAALLANYDEHLEELTAAEKNTEALYFKHAEKLSKARRQQVASLAQGTTAILQSLGLDNAQFNVELSTQEPAASGLENIEFVFSANPGQALRPLAKVASGGELSRTSLAIQVMCAQAHTVPCLIFDEVDVGIGGGIAEIVGRLLRQLSTHAQVLCITHQPQVASQGEQHWHVRKKQENNETLSYVAPLAGNERVTEIARMLGGLELTASTIAHAKEMLALSQKPILPMPA